MSAVILGMAIAILIACTAMAFYAQVLKARLGG